MVIAFYDGKESEKLVSSFAALWFCWVSKKVTVGESLSLLVCMLLCYTAAQKIIINVNILSKVSHHPPISAVQCEADDFSFHVTVQPKLKFWGKGVEIQPKGMVTLKLPKYVMCNSLPWFIRCSKHSGSLLLIYSFKQTWMFILFSLVVLS